LVPCSTLTEEGVEKVKEIACDKLLALRVDEKLNKVKRDDVLSKLHVALPKPRDQKSRPPNIPSKVLAKQKSSSLLMETDDDNNNNKSSKKEEVKARYEKWKGNLWENADLDPEWDPTFFGPDWREQYDLANDEWKYDAIPEIMDGMNVADYYDPEIMKKLILLEEEEEERVEKEQEEEEREEEEEKEKGGGWRMNEEDIMELRDWWNTKKLIRLEHGAKTTGIKNHQNLPIKDVKKTNEDLQEFEHHLIDMGIDPSKAASRIKERSKSRSRALSRGRKRVRQDYLEGQEEKERARSKTPKEEGLRDAKQKEEVERLVRKSRKIRNKQAKKGEGDRTFLTKKPKHLFSGKRGIGKTDRR